MNVIDNAKILSFYKEAKECLKGKIPIPRMVSVWISQICNLRCTYCLFAEQNKKNHKFMEKDKFFKFIREISALEIESLEMSGGGESTLHPQFYDFGEYALSKGLKVGLFTNGLIPLDYNKIKNFSYIRFSLDAISNDDYNYIKNPLNKNNFDKVILNIKKLIKEKKNNERPRIGIKFLISFINYSKIENMISLARNIGANYVQFKSIHNSDIVPTSRQKTIANKIIKLNKLKVVNKKFFIIGNLEKDNNIIKCFLSPIHSVMDVKGNLYICCYFNGRDLCIGNVFREGFRNVWGSKRHQRLIKKININECNKFDCRWTKYNQFMYDIIKKDVIDISFI